MKKIVLFLRWLLVALFGFCLFATGLHWSSLFLVGAILLVLPVNTIEELLKKFNIKGTLSLLLALAFAIVAFASAPVSQQAPAEEKAKESTEEVLSSSTMTSPSGSTTELANTTQKSTTTTALKPVATTTESANPTTTTTTKATTTTVKTTNSTTTTTKATTTTTWEPEPEPEAEMVWIPQSGKKYHSHAGCSGMKNPEEVTLEEAEEMGYTPCKRCY